MPVHDRRHSTVGILKVALIVLLYDVSKVRRHFDVSKPIHDVGLLIVVSVLRSSGHQCTLVPGVLLVVQHRVPSPEAGQERSQVQFIVTWVIIEVAVEIVQQGYRLSVYNLPIFRDDAV